MPRSQTAVVGNYDVGPANTLAVAFGQVPNTIVLQFVVKHGKRLECRFESLTANNEFTLECSSDGVVWSAITDTTHALYSSAEAPGAAAQGSGSGPGATGINLQGAQVVAGGMFDFGFNIRPGLDNYLRLRDVLAHGVLQIRGDAALDIMKL